MKPCKLSTSTPGGEYPRRWINGRMEYEHRLVLETKLGRPIEDGMVTRHLCHEKRCVEAEHLVESTNSENMLDSDVEHTGTAETYFCGHPRSAENSFWHKDRTRKAGGGWRCRECKYKQNIAWRKANPERVRELGRECERLYRARKKEAASK